MGFLKTFLARPLAWLVAVAVGIGGGLLTYLVGAIEAAKVDAVAQLGGIEALIVGGLLGVLAKFLGALVAKYVAKPLVPVEPPPPSASRRSQPGAF